MKRVAQRNLASNQNEARELLEEEINAVSGASGLIELGPGGCSSSGGTRTGCGPDMDRTTDYDC